MVKIYTLNDPITNEVRYVGKTISSLKDRLNRHLRDNEKCKRAWWVKSLQKKGMNPTIELIEEVADSEWQFEEMFYIGYLKFLGCRLTNMTEGGEGTTGHRQSEETKNKRRISMQYYKPSKEHIEKMNKARLSRPVSEITKRKIGAKAKGFRHTEETKMKLREQRLGKHLSEYHIEKIRIGSKTKSVPNRKPVLQKDAFGNIIAEFPSILSAAKSINGWKECMSVACNKGKMYKGYIWEFNTKQLNIN